MFGVGQHPRSGLSRKVGAAGQGRKTLVAPGFFGLPKVGRSRHPHVQIAQRQVAQGCLRMARNQKLASGLHGPVAEDYVPNLAQRIGRSLAVNVHKNGIFVRVPRTTFEADLAEKQVFVHPPFKHEQGYAVARAADDVVGEHAVAHRTLRARAALEGGVVAFEDAVGHRDVFDGPGVGLEADGVVAGGDEAVGNAHVRGRGDVNAVGVGALRMVADGQAVHQGTLAFAEHQHVRRRMLDGEVANGDVLALVKADERLRAIARLKVFVVESVALAVYHPQARQGHMLQAVGRDEYAVGVMADVGAGQQGAASSQVQFQVATQAQAARQESARRAVYPPAALGQARVNGALDGRGVERLAVAERAKIGDDKGAAGLSEEPDGRAGEQKQQGANARSERHRSGFCPMTCASAASPTHTELCQVFCMQKRLSVGITQKLTTCFFVRCSYCSS